MGKGKLTNQNVELLIKIISKYKNIIFDTTQRIPHFKRRAVWEKIAVSYNNVVKQKRNSRQLQIKMRNAIAKAKKEAIEYVKDLKAYKSGTGSPPKPLSWLTLFTINAFDIKISGILVRPKASGSAGSSQVNNMDLRLASVAFAQNSDIAQSEDNSQINHEENANASTSMEYVESHSPESQDSVELNGNLPEISVVDLTNASSQTSNDAVSNSPPLIERLLPTNYNLLNKKMRMLLFKNALKTSKLEQRVKLNELHSSEIKKKGNEIWLNERRLAFKDVQLSLQLKELLIKKARLEIDKIQSVDRVSQSNNFQAEQPPPTISENTQESNSHTISYCYSVATEQEPINDPPPTISENAHNNLCTSSIKTEPTEDTPPSENLHSNLGTISHSCSIKTEPAPLEDSPPIISLCKISSSSTSIEDHLLSTSGNLRNNTSNIPSKRPLIKVKHVKSINGQLWQPILVKKPMNVPVPLQTHKLHNNIETGEGLIEGTQLVISDSHSSHSSSIPNTTNTSQMSGDHKLQAIPPCNVNPQNGAVKYTYKPCVVCRLRKIPSETCVYCVMCKVPLHQGECYEFYHDGL